jgi:hypothetical protein
MSAPRLDPPHATVLRPTTSSALPQLLLLLLLPPCVCVCARARSYATVLVPSLALAPAYMAGQVEFGVITQASDAQ